MKKQALILFILIIVVSFGCSRRQPSVTTITDYNNVVFNDVRDPQLYKNILVVYANQGEMISFMTKMNQYRYNRIATQSVAIFQSKLDDKKVYVVLSSNIDRIPRQRYGLIHLKGHTVDMEPMISMVKGRQYLIKDSETILLLGGCETSKMTSLIPPLKVIPITTVYIGQSAHNDYIDLQLHSMLDTMSVAQAIQQIKRNAPQTAQEMVFPQFH